MNLSCCPTTNLFKCFSALWNLGYSWLLGRGCVVVVECILALMPGLIPVEDANFQLRPARFFGCWAILCLSFLYNLPDHYLSFVPSSSFFCKQVNYLNAFLFLWSIIFLSHCCVDTKHQFKIVLLHFTWRNKVPSPDYRRQKECYQLMLLTGNWVTPSRLE